MLLGVGRFLPEIKSDCIWFWFVVFYCWYRIFSECGFFFFSSTAENVATATCSSGYVALATRTLGVIKPP